VCGAGVCSLEQTGFVHLSMPSSIHEHTLFARAHPTRRRWEGMLSGFRKIRQSYPISHTPNRFGSRSLGVVCERTHVLRGVDRRTPCNGGLEPTGWKGKYCQMNNALKKRLTVVRVTKETIHNLLVMAYSYQSRWISPRREWLLNQQR